MYVSTNIRFLRRVDGNLSQTEWGKKFNLSRGQVDSYERKVAKPDNLTLQTIATHYKLSVNILTNKSLAENPGILMAGELFNDNGPSRAATPESDLIRAKDDLISTLQDQIKFQQDQIRTLTEALATHR